MSYLSQINAAAVQYGVPPAIAVAVAQQESNVQQFTPTGAVVSRYEPHLNDYSYGIFQLLGSTARDLGVDPKDPTQNIQGGVRYLRMVYDWTGGNDWRAALQAYNGGIGNWQRGTTTIDAKRYADQVLARAGVPSGTAPSAPVIYAINSPTLQQPGNVAITQVGQAPDIGYQGPGTLTDLFGNPVSQLDTWSVDSLLNDREALLALGGIGLVLLIAALA